MLDGQIDLDYVKTDEQQVADVFTKALDKEFKYFRNRLRVLKMEMTSSRGSVEIASLEISRR